VDLAYCSGTQALVHLLELQARRDHAAGLDTAGFVSGYRGSPLGGLDQALWGARQLLAAQKIHFEPGINEDLAATAVWGTQQVNLFPGARHQGVFAMWYGKGPGADRSIDVFKHANAAGTSRFGGVLAVVGDDHGAKSSSLPHQSDHVFAAAMIPVLSPAGVQEMLDLGIHGWAMSRFSGCWVALRTVSDVVETSAVVVVDPLRVQTVKPGDFGMPPEGLGIRWPDTPLQQEMRLQRYKVYAAVAYARRNGINRMVIDSPTPRFGIVTSGKSYLDVRQALDMLGIDEPHAADIGLRLYKVGMTWPIDPVGVRHFAEGLEEILVVEEKRQVIEYQLKEELYNWREDVRPRVIGKYDEKGEWDLPIGRWLLPPTGELGPAMIARVIAGRIGRFYTSPRIRDRLAFLDDQDRVLAQRRTDIARVPHYCSGCPHNTSTKVPEGSRALAGIGCHYMAVWLSPSSTQTFSQMGGEGVAWVGQAPFTDTPHVFANLGDGTYSHSGILAIRQAVSANVPITYKILFNDAVAMTGGQPVEGSLTVPKLVRQVAAEGVERIVVVTDEPHKYRGEMRLPPGIPVRHRRELDAVQRELRTVSGVTVLVYDQTCAAEKRRRRKRGSYPDPAKRVVINGRVCEGCGDCSQKSNCLSVAPVETEFGRKRRIDQSSCNKDFSCIEGFCPSFVTVEGGRLRQGEAVSAAFPPLPEPIIPDIPEPYNILVTGVGGTGVVTIGALLGTAAALEGKGISTLDMAGLAQKGGPVWSHIRIAPRHDHLFVARIPAGEAKLLLGCDIIVAADTESLSKVRPGVTHAVVNSDFAVTSDFVRAFAAQARTGDVEHLPDPQFPLPALEQQIADSVGSDHLATVPATRLATALLGDSIATNLFLVGYAFQKGFIPLRAESILKAIDMNGVATALNAASFAWGRRAAVDLASVEALARPREQNSASERLSATLDEVIARRVADLTEYQSSGYAARYAALVQRVRDFETSRFPGRDVLTQAVARYYYKLLAYKDEYEVARLFTETGFLGRIAATFEGDTRLVFHLAPPLWAPPDRITGEPRKRAYGPWVLPMFRLLARLRRLRGTPLDVFGYTAERRRDRRLIRDYEGLVAELLDAADEQTFDVAVQLASIPEQIRGYGPVRARHLAHAKQREAELLAKFRQGADAR
jgi:indolepyruvate ferredoxin oxidoreductase